MNLIRHHLDDAVKAGDIAVIDFTCWWFRGEEALALAFFRELYAGLSPTLGERLKKFPLVTEATELNSIGNSHLIRHSEISQVPVIDVDQVDYLFHRLFAMIQLMLRKK